MDLRGTLLLLGTLFAGIVGGFVLGWELSGPSGTDRAALTERVSIAHRDANRWRNQLEDVIATNDRLRREHDEVRDALAPLELPDGTTVTTPVRALYKRIEARLFRVEWLQRLVRLVDDWAHTAHGERLATLDDLPPALKPALDRALEE